MIFKSENYFFDNLSSKEKKILLEKDPKILKKINIIIKKPYVFKNYFNEIKNALSLINKEYSWKEISNAELDYFFKNYEAQEDNNFVSATTYLLLDLYPKQCFKSSYMDYFLRAQFSDFKYYLKENINPSQIRNYFKESESHLETAPTSNLKNELRNFYDLNASDIYSKLVKNTDTKISLTVICHCFYIDELTNVIGRINPINIKENFGIKPNFILNICKSQAEEWIIKREDKDLGTFKKQIKAFIRKSGFEIVKIIFTENIGRDWGGFINAAKQINFDTDMLWICHCKKSPQHNPNYTKQWLDKLFLPINKSSIKITSNLFKYLSKTKSEFIIASASCRDQTFPGNIQDFHNFANLLNIEDEFRNIDYLAGSHFLITPKLFIEFTNKFDLSLVPHSNISYDKQLCGTFAHQLERLIFSYARSNMFQIIWMS